MGGPHLVDRARGLRLGVRRVERIRRPARAHGGAGDPVGHPAHLQLRPEGRVPARRRGLPLGGAARPDGAVAVPAVQPVLHLDLPERADPAVLPAGVHRVRGRPVAARRLGRRARDRVPGVPRGRGGGRPAAVGVPPLEDGRARRRAHARAGVPADGPVPRLAASELLLRAGAVVGVLRVRGGRDGRSGCTGPSPARCCSSLLFIGSTVFTESISRSKYPDYDAYRARTSAIVPWFPRGRVAAGERTA